MYVSFWLSLWKGTVADVFAPVYRGQPRDVDIQKEMAKGRREAAGIEPREHHRPKQERAPRPEMASDEAVMDRFKKR